MPEESPRALPPGAESCSKLFPCSDALSINLETVDLKAAVVVAEQTKLSLYDASYLWLARALDAELVTLDEKLARADKNLRGSQ